MPQATSDHIPITIFVHGKQEIQLTGQKPIPGGLAWSAKSDDTAVAEVTVTPVGGTVFPTIFWELTIRGIKTGKTLVHVKEEQALPHPNPKYAFTFEVTVHGLQA